MNISIMEQLLNIVPYGTEFFDELELICKDKINGCCLTLINNPNSINAFSNMDSSIPNIYLYSGTIIKIWQCCSLINLPKYFFWFATNDMNYVNDFLNTKSLVHSSFSSFLTRIALRIIIYHEIGHHKLEHIKNSQNKQLNNQVRLKQEIDADLYAAKLSVEEFDLLYTEIQRDTIMQFFSKADALHIILFAYSIVNLLMPIDPDLFNEDDEEDLYPPSMYREFIIFGVILSELYKQIETEVVSIYANNPELIKYVELLDHIQVFDKNDNMNYSAYLLLFLNINYIFKKSNLKCIKTYSDIWGRYIFFRNIFFDQFLNYSAKNYPHYIS